MDSLTQIILGAAVGEIATGRKLGNRAMVWGAIAGTIPDLDVIANAFMGKLDALAFHRGISHSIFFAITFSFLIAACTYWFYGRDLQQRRSVRIGVSLFILLLLVMVGYVIASVFFRAIGAQAGSIAGIIATGLVSLSGWKLWNNYIIKKAHSFHVSYWYWYRLFFWTIFTHPILDCFTTYGTQIFMPFSNYRVSFNTISVADPIYTIPFLICVSMASRFSREDKRRRFYAWLGIGLSSIYMVFTIFHKFSINQVMEKTLEAKNIVYTRFMTNPTILNNALWSGTVETEEGYYLGQYSIFDQEDSFKLTYIPRRADLIDQHLEDSTIACLRWFSNNYYTFLQREDGRIQMNDLRFGRIGDGPMGENDYIFRFIVEKNKDGSYQLEESLGGPDNSKRKGMMGTLWQRIKGV